VDVRVILAAKIQFDLPMQADFAVIVANGDFSATASQVDGIRQCKCLIAVDGGIEHCIHAKLRPHLLVGDFDSVSPSSLAFFDDVPRVTLSQDKDESDLEVAIEKALENTKGPIGVFGALGKRTDHLLYNLYLLARYPGRVTLESEKERLFVIREKHTLISHPGQTISLLPLNGAVKGVTTHGLQWELKNAAFDKQWMSLSNVCLGNEVEITLDQGDLLCCLENANR
jgi:thiamine pyrophosphokinase